MLGITFKENCPDIRNTKTIDVFNSLKSFSMDVEVYDPWASPEEVFEEYGIDLCLNIYSKQYDAIVHCVAHNEFNTIDLIKLKKEITVIYDVKGTLKIIIIDKRL